MKLTLVLPIMMLLLVFTVAAVNETTVFDEKSGNCPNTANCLIPSNYNGLINVKGGSVVYGGQTFSASSGSTITVKDGKIESFVGGLTQPAVINGVKVKGSDLEIHGSTITRTGMDGEIEDVPIQNAQEVTVVNGIIAGNIIGTGKVGGLTYINAKFTFDTNTKKYSISGKDAHTVIPPRMPNVGITAKDGATVELIDGSGLMYTNGEVKVKDGFPFIRGGSLNNLYFEEREFVGVCHTAGCYNSAPKGVAAGGDLGFETPPVVILTENSFEGHNLIYPIRFGAGNDYIKVNTIDGKEKVFGAYGDYIFIDGSKTANNLVIEHGYVRNGDLLLEVNEQGNVNKRNLPSLAAEGFAGGTTQLSLTAKVDPERTPTPLENFYILIKGADYGYGVEPVTEEYKEEPAISVNYCPASGGTTGAATRWITGMDVASCMQTGKCSLADLPPYAVSNPDGSVTCEGVKCEDLFKKMGFKYEKTGDRYSLYTEKNFGKYAYGGEYTLTPADNTFLNSVVGADAYGTSQLKGGAEQLQSYLRARFKNNNIIVDEDVGKAYIHNIYAENDKDFVTVTFDFETKSISYRVDKSNKYIEVKLKSKDQGIETVSEDNTIVFTDRSRGKYDVSTGNVRKDVTSVSILTSEDVQKRMTALTSAPAITTKPLPSGQTAERPTTSVRNEMTNAQMLEATLHDSLVGK